MAQPIVKVSDADRAAAAELCDLWIPTSRQEEVAEIIAKHVKDAQLNDALIEAVRESDRRAKPVEAERGARVPLKAGKL